MIKLYLFGTFRCLVNDQLANSFRSDKTRALLVYLALADNRPIARPTLANLLWEGYQPESALANLRMTLSNLRQILAPIDLLEVTRQSIKLRVDSAQFWCDALAPDLFTYKAPPQEFFPGGERIDSAPFQRWLEERRAYYEEERKARYSQPERTTTIPTAVVPHNLPRTLTPLIGRTRDFEALSALVTHPEHPLITLVGEGGVGKTRLALAIAHANAEWGMRPVEWQPAPLQNTVHSPSAAPHFPDGVWFVPLAGIVPGENLANHLAAAIGEATRFRFSGVDSLTDQLCRYLRDKHALIILDNFEELTAGAEWLILLLQQTTALKLLVTSRHRLHLEAEHLFRLDGLTTPDEKAMPALGENTLLTYSSIQLFVHRAERIMRDFRLTQENRADIARVCRFVGGLPLGIVLATTLLEEYTCAEVANLLDENYTILAASLADLPLRQRSIHTVLDTSWRLLDPAERLVLARCAIFRGAFSSEAAFTVADAAPVLLERLEAKSLLRLTGLGRYEMHELVRQYAATQLHLLPTIEEEVYERHSAYYLTLVQQHREQLHRSAEAQYRIREELENVRAAWAWALRHLHTEAMRATLPALVHFYGLAGLQQEAAAALAETVAIVRPQLQATPHNQSMARLFTGLLLELAYFQLNLAQPDQAVGLVTEALGILPTLHDPELEINAYFRQGDIAWAQADYPRHRAAYAQSLAQAQAQGWQQLVAHSLTNLGMNHDVQGEYSAAINNYQAALAIAQQIDHRQQINIIYNNLGVSHELLGEFSAALHYYQQSLQTSRELADQEGIGIAHLNLGILFTVLGDWGNARADLEQALLIFRNGGHQRLEAKTLGHLAWLTYKLDNHEEAAAYAQNALTLAQRGEFQTVEAEALTVLGNILLAEQRHAEASATYQRALARWQRVGSKPRALLAQSGLAQNLLAQHDLLGALGIVEQILPYLADHTHPPAYSSVFLTCYQILAQGQDPRALDILQQGYAALQKQAATIADADLRQSFLQHVPANHELLRLIAA